MFTVLLWKSSGHVLDIEKAYNGLYLVSHICEGDVWMYCRSSRGYQGINNKRELEQHLELYRRFAQLGVASERCLHPV